MASWPSSIEDVTDQREMLDLLVRRDLKAQYKDSALGFLWSLARPLMQLAIYFVVLGQFLGAARGIPDFAVYIFTGLTAMGLFTEIAVGGTGSILANAGLVKKVYVPREVFPLASLGSGLLQLRASSSSCCSLATLVVGAFPLHPEILYAIPSLAVIVVYGAGIRPALRRHERLSARHAVPGRGGHDAAVLGIPVVYSWADGRVDLIQSRSGSSCTRTIR